MIMEEEEKKASVLIKDINKDDRPREKALAKGLDSLTDAELMALIFSTGIKGRSVIDICQDILDGCDRSLWQLTNMSITELCAKYKGIGIAKATTLLAGLELGKRAAAQHYRTLASGAITSSQAAYNSMRDRFEGLQHEEFWIITLNRAGKIIQRLQISRGGTAATAVDIKLILKAALNYLASSIILFHNHPSGTLRPSLEDDRLTRRIIEGAKAIDVKVNDHIIITDTDYYSYNDNGRL